MQLASGLPGAGLSQSPDLLKALQYNPLLYYSYYAQMLTALQAQQKLMEINNSSGSMSSNNNNNNNSTSIKDILSPLKLGNMTPGALSKDHNQVRWVAILWLYFEFKIFCNKYSVSTVGAPLLTLTLTSCRAAELCSKYLQSYLVHTSSHCSLMDCSDSKVLTMLQSDCTKNILLKSDLFPAIRSISSPLKSKAKHIIVDSLTPKLPPYLDMSTTIIIWKAKACSMQPTLTTNKLYQTACLLHNHALCYIISLQSTIRRDEFCVSYTGLWLVSL